MISIEVYGLGDEFFRHYVHLHVYIYALVYNTSSFKLVRIKPVFFCMICGCDCI